MPTTEASRPYAKALVEAARALAPDLPENVPDDPVEWIESHPVVSDGEEIAPRGHVWSKQREVVAALMRERARVVVHASQGNGKTWLASRLAAWWMLKHRGLDARVVVIGPTWDQLDAGMLHEFRMDPSFYRPGRLSFSRRVVTLDGKDLIAWRSPPLTMTQRNPLQGIHSDLLLVLIEEASNFGFKLWNEATVAITSGGTRGCWPSGTRWTWGRRTTRRRRWGPGGRWCTSGRSTRRT